MQCYPVESTGLGCPTHQIAALDNIGKNGDLTNPNESRENENPGALAGATGADVEKKSVEPAYLERLKGARNLQAAIDACDPALAAIIMDRALDDLRIGEPGTALLNAMDQAITWAEWATPVEHKAYCLASFNAMPPKVRTTFLYYVQGRAAA